MSVEEEEAHPTHIKDVYPCMSGADPGFQVRGAHLK